MDLQLYIGLDVLNLEICKDQILRNHVKKIMYENMITYKTEVFISLKALKLSILCET